MTTNKTYGWFKVYWNFLDDLTPEAALLLSYLIDIEPIMNRKEGEYFRLSNSFIQERFLTWSDYTIKAKLDELLQNGYISMEQKFEVEHKKGCRTRWIKLNPKSNPEDNPYNNPNNNPEKFGINKTNKIEEIEKTYNAETSSANEPSSDNQNSPLVESTVKEHHCFDAPPAPPPPVAKPKRQSLKDQLTDYINSLSYLPETKDVMFKWLFAIGLTRNVRFEQFQDMIKKLWDGCNDEALFREAIEKSYLNGWFGFYPPKGYKPTPALNPPTQPKSEPSAGKRIPTTILYTEDELDKLINNAKIF